MVCSAMAHSYKSSPPPCGIFFLVCKEGHPCGIFFSLVTAMVRSAMVTIMQFSTNAAVSQPWSEKLITIAVGVDSEKVNDQHHLEREEITTGLLLSANAEREEIVAGLLLFAKAALPPTMCIKTPCALSVGNSSKICVRTPSFLWPSRLLGLPAQDAETVFP